ncbi:hypothetical protein AJ88_02595 [Mesorhizobium amorphae CCBAU 01583]|nr:hypothetical protein AJ88_02595 [Mesorhizobium amorphae CCBAU 01583]
MLARLVAALSPLLAFRDEADADLAALTRASIIALENLGRAVDGSLVDFYAGDAGEKLAELLRGLVAASAPFSFAAVEWPDVMEAMIAPETVKPAQGTDRSIAIWGALEARLQSVDTLVIGGLNEGVWPRKPESDRFMSRLMKTGIDLEPPERRIGLAAHDFQMAMGARKVVLTRSARSGDAPAVPSRWLQRLLTFIGKEHAAAPLRRGENCWPGHGRSTPAKNRILRQGRSRGRRSASGRSTSRSPRSRRCAATPMRSTPGGSSA